MNLSPGQINSFMRHVYTVLGTLVAVAGATSFMDPKTVQTIVTAVHQIGDGVVSIATGIGALVPFASGAYAAWSASHKSKMQSIAASPQTPTAVKQVVTAALSNPATPGGAKP